MTPDRPSSRRRSATRLNSGVMRTPIIAMALLLASCGVIRPLSHVAYRTCPAAQAEWQVLANPPDNAAELIEAARPDLTSLGYGRRPRLFWFRGQSDSLLLCRTIVDPYSLDSCGSQAWEFQRVGERWQLQEDIGTVVVCG